MDTSSDSSMEDIFLLLDSTYIRNVLMQKPPKIGIHPINRKRGKFGEFHHLYSDLRNDEKRFFEYMRMTPSTFDFILGKIRSEIVKNWQNCHLEPISIEERLVILIR